MKLPVRRAGVALTGDIFAAKVENKGILEGEERSAHDCTGDILVYLFNNEHSLFESMLH